MTDLVSGRFENVFEIPAPARRLSLHVPKPVKAVPVGLRVVRLGNGSFRCPPS